MKTQLDARFAEGYCAICHHTRTLIPALTVTDAVKGYHQLQAERELKRRKLKDAKDKQT